MSACLVAKKSSILLQKHIDESPYKSLLEATKEYDLNDTEVYFDTIGVAPIDAPVHSVRIGRQRKIVASGGLRAESPLTKNLEVCEPAELEVSQVCGSILLNQTTVLPVNTLSVFQTCSFFKPCSRRFLSQLITSGGARSQVGLNISRGEAVYKKGQPGSSMFILARGEAEVFVNEDSQKHIGVGDYFGELQMMGIISQRQETVWAKTSLQLFEIRHEVFTRLLKASKSEEDKGLQLDQRRASNGGSHLLRRMQTVRVDAMAFPNERRFYEHEAVNMYRAVRADRGITRKVSKRSCTHPLLFFMTSMDEAHDPEPEVDKQEKRDAARIKKSKGFMNRIIESLQRDKRNGLKVPSDCRRRHLSFMMLRSSEVQNTKTGAANETEQFDQSHLQSSLEVEDNMIEVDLLPPMEYLSSVHKRDLAKKLYEDVLFQKPYSRLWKQSTLRSRQCKDRFSEMTSHAVDSPFVSAGDYLCAEGFYA